MEGGKPKLFTVESPSATSNDYPYQARSRPFSHRLVGSWIVDAGEIRWCVRISQGRSSGVLRSPGAQRDAGRFGVVRLLRSGVLFPDPLRSGLCRRCASEAVDDHRDDENQQRENRGAEIEVTAGEEIVDRISFWEEVTWDAEYELHA